MSLACGGAAGLISSTATFPLDLIRRRMQLEGQGGLRKYRGYADVARTVWSNGGLRGFYAGIIPEYYKVRGQLMECVMLCQSSAFDVVVLLTHDTVAYAQRCASQHIFESCLSNVQVIPGVSCAYMTCAPLSCLKVPSHLPA